MSIFQLLKEEKIIFVEWKNPWQIFIKKIKCWTKETTNKKQSIFSVRDNKEIKSSKKKWFIIIYKLIENSNDNYSVYKLTIAFGECMVLRAYF